MVTSPDPTPDRDDADLIGDVLERVRKIAAANDGKFSAADAQAVESAVRKAWAGNRPYIASRSNTERVHAQIRSDWQRGERLPFLARRYNYTERRIRQILWPKPAQTGQN